jgi:uncharacterized phage protein (TIGR02218 family)
MSLDALESSVDSASPRELFLFMQGASSWALSGADEDVAYAGRLFTRETIVRGAIDHSKEESGGNIEIRIAASNPVAAQFVGVPVALPVYLTVYRVHRTGSAAVMFVGRVIQASLDGPEATLECAPLSGALSRQIPSLTYQRECNWSLYGAGCQVNREAFKVTAVVDAVGGLMLSAAAFAGKPDDWFRYGYVELAGGIYAGDRRAVMAHTGSTLTLNAPFRNVSVGDLVYAFAGCDKLETTCASKFSNLVHHLGFSRIPDRNPHDGRMG